MLFNYAIALQYLHYIFKESYMYLNKNWWDSNLNLLFLRQMLWPCHASRVSPNFLLYVVCQAYTNMLLECLASAIKKESSVDLINAMFLVSEIVSSKEWPSRVTRCVCEKVAQNVAQSIFVKINT
jgi:hypothetical protein